MILAVIAALASWYGFESGSQTASGEKFNPLGISCAHRTLPFGTILTVTHKGKSIQCRVNDKGPFVKGRSLDLSLGAARALGCEAKGVCEIQMSTSSGSVNGRVTEVPFGNTMGSGPHPVKSKSPHNKSKKTKSKMMEETYRFISFSYLN